MSKTTKRKWEEIMRTRRVWVDACSKEVLPSKDKRGDENNKDCARNVLLLIETRAHYDEVNGF